MSPAQVTHLWLMPIHGGVEVFAQADYSLAREDAEDCPLVLREF